MSGRAWALALLPAGFVFGLVGGFMTEHRITLGGIAIPWGTVLVVAALTVTVRALNLGFGSRVAGAMYYLGWLLATGLLALPNPSGDVVFSASVAAYGYLLAGTLLGGAAAAWPLFLPAPEAAGVADE